MAFEHRPGGHRCGHPTPAPSDPGWRRRSRAGRQPPQTPHPSTVLVWSSSTVWVVAGAGIPHPHRLDPVLAEAITGWPSTSPNATPSTVLVWSSSTVWVVTGAGIPHPHCLDRCWRRRSRAGRQPPQTPHPPPCWCGLRAPSGWSPVRASHTRTVSSAAGGDDHGLAINLPKRHTLHRVGVAFEHRPGGHRCGHPTPAPSHRRWRRRPRAGHQSPQPPHPST